jgi:hypothetical protein
MSTGTISETWSYTAIDGIAFVCLNSSITEASGTSTESDCIEVIDGNGTLGTHLRVTVKDADGRVMTLAN